MVKKTISILKKEDGIGMLDMIVGFFVLVIVFFPLVSAVFIYKDREHVLDVITETYLNKMLVEGGMSLSLKDELLDELTKRGYEKSKLDIIVYPDNAQPGKYTKHLKGSIPDSNLVYAKRGEIIKLIVIDKRRNRLTALKEQYDNGSTVKSSYPTSYKYGMSEEP